MDRYRKLLNPATHLDSKAVKMVRGEMGLKNVEIMIPFVRTLDMAKDVNEVLEPRYFRGTIMGPGGVVTGVVGNFLRWVWGWGWR